MIEKTASGSTDSTWEVLAAARFALAMVVVIVHLPELAQNPLVHMVANLSGLVAVLCFLLISGFSIAHSVSRTTDGFYRRRLLRIYPLYAMAVIVPIAVQAFRGHLQANQVSNAVQNLFFLQTFVTAPMFVNGVIWTLAIEVAFYLLAPLLVGITTKRLIGLAGISAAAFVAFPHVARHFNYFIYYGCIPFGAGFLLLGWAWLAGFIYYRHRNHPHAALVIGATFIGLLTLNPMFTNCYYPLTVIFTIAAVGFGRHLKINGGVRKALLFCGNVSFPMYLFHFPLFHFLSGTLHLHSATVLIAAAVAAGLVGILVDAQLKVPARIVCDFTLDAFATCGRVTMLATDALIALCSDIRTIGMPRLSHSGLRTQEVG